MQRESQVALRWQPFWLTETDVKSNRNLLKSWEIIMETVEKTKDKLLPVLVDENLHYRMAWFMYSANYAKWNGRLWLDRVPLLFGV